MVRSSSFAKNHLGGQILYRSLHPSKKRRHSSLLYFSVLFLRFPNRQVLERQTRSVTNKNKESFEPKLTRKKILVLFAENVSVLKIKKKFQKKIFLFLFESDFKIWLIVYFFGFDQSDAPKRYKYSPRDKKNWWIFSELFYGVYNKILIYFWKWKFSKLAFAFQRDGFGNFLAMEIRMKQFQAEFSNAHFFKFPKFIKNLKINKQKLRNVSKLLNDSKFFQNYWKCENKIFFNNFKNNLRFLIIF